MTSFNDEKLNSILEEDLNEHLQTENNQNDSS